MYQKSWSYPIYCSWDMVCDGCNCYFSFWAIFCPFTPLPLKQSEKWKFQKKRKKKTLEISSFYTSVRKIIIICHILLLRHGVWWLLFFILGYFLLFYPPNSTKINISKRWKKRLEISWFYKCVPKIMIEWCTIPEIWCATDRGTDRWMEKVTYRSGSLT